MSRKAHRAAAEKSMIPAMAGTETSSDPQIERLRSALGTIEYALMVHSEENTSEALEAVEQARAAADALEARGPAISYNPAVEQPHDFIARVARGDRRSSDELVAGWHVPELEELWETIERPGYFGSRRDEIQRCYEEAYGAGNWRIVWQLGANVIPFAQMVMLYEDAYFHFLSLRPDVLQELVATASDVYDDAPSNVASGLDYSRQETGRTHVQDIAIRRAVIRHGERFRGEKLLQIRDHEGEHPLSMTLSPGQVPFHRPELIVQPEIEPDWWLPGSVESFYQSNKLLQIRR